MRATTDRNQTRAETNGFWHPSGVRLDLWPGSGGVAGAQPPANFWQPSGLARSARPQVKRHALERAHRAEGFGDRVKLEERNDHFEAAEKSREVWCSSSKRHLPQ